MTGPNTYVPKHLRPIHDLFAAGGGWDHGIELLGLDPRFLLGFEWSPVASTTARLAGYPRLVADVSKLDPAAITEALNGQAGSPPCQGFTLQGHGKSRRDVPILLDAIRAIGEGRDPRAEVALLMEDARSVLVLEPLRWALQVRPAWVAWEQVPPVQVLWDAAAEVLRAHGYRVATGVLNTEQFDVPQNRQRAVLLGSLDRDVQLPPPVRSKFYPSTPARLDEGFDPWLTIQDVLPDRAGLACRSNYSTGGDTSRRGIRRSDQPAFTVTSKFDRNRWSNGDRMTPAEASVIQTFPGDHPWHGSTVDQVNTQIGDAVPPMFAAHLLAALGVGDLNLARKTHAQSTALPYVMGQLA